MREPIERAVEFGRSNECVKDPFDCLGDRLFVVRACTVAYGNESVRLAARRE